MARGALARSQAELAIAITGFAGPGEDDDEEGLVHFAAPVADGEAMFEAALDAGADDVQSGEGGHDIFCAPDDLGPVRDALEQRFGPPEAARLDARARLAAAQELELSVHEHAPARVGEDLPLPHVSRFRVADGATGDVRAYLAGAARSAE